MKRLLAGSWSVIALDLDGTALNSDHELPSSVAAALRDAAQAGIHVVLVSARAARSVQSFVRLIGLNEPYVALNGALFVSERGDFLSELSMSPGDVGLVLTLSRRCGLIANLYSRFEWYVNAVDPLVEEESRILGFSPTVLERLDEHHTDGVQKILVMGTPAGVRDLHRELDGHPTQLQVTFSKPTYLEITQAGVTKGRALSQICDYFGISCEDVIAIGDNHNDRDMIESAGLGVVVNSAPEELKRAADLVIPGNDENGVGQFVRQLLAEQAASRHDTGV